MYKHTHYLQITAAGAFDRSEQLYNKVSSQHFSVPYRPVPEVSKSSSEI